MSRIIRVVRVLEFIGPEEWIDKLDALDQLHYERGSKFPVTPPRSAKELSRTKEVVKEETA
jgi:hypothetical protein